MIPTTFEQSNKTLAPPRGVSEEECSSLPIFTNGEVCISRWAPTPAERVLLAEEGSGIWVFAWTGQTQMPVSISAQNPFSGENAIQPELPSIGAVLAHLAFLSNAARAAGLDHLALSLTDLHLLEVSGLGDVAAGTLRELAAPIWKAAEQEPPAPAEIPS